MTLMVILFLFLALAVGVTLTGAQPDDTKPAGKTRLMTAARVILVVLCAFAVAAALRGYAG